LSRVARTDIQRTVTLMTIVTSLVGLVGVWVGGQLERIGLVQVLLLQGLLFAAGAIAVHRLPAMPVTAGRARPHVLEGIRASWRLPLIRNVIGLNFLSSLFNAGAYIIAVPFIVKDVYFGDADFFATVIIVFTVGSIGSNIVLLRYMPLHRPGQLFIWMQITRVAILGVLYLKPNLAIFHLCILAWGLNMGVTTTLVRTTVQELAPDEHRAQILSVLLLSFMVSAPVSAMLLGTLIAGYDPLAALLPGVVVSLVIFVVGLFWSGLWAYESADGRSRKERLSAA
jgi:Transmembrane secretion effector